MYDENKWNEVNNENEKKNNEQPVNTQNTQNTLIFICKKSMRDTGENYAGHFWNVTDMQ